jgi:hypothetical protein
VLLDGVAPEWDSAHYFPKGIASRRSGSTYVALVGNVGVDPATSPETWYQLDAAGSSGQAGTDGKTVRHGTGAPGSGLGVEGDFYIETVEGHAASIYGPKTGASWGTSTPITAPPIPATGSTAGVVRLSKAPASEADPVALGANERGAANGVASLDGAGLLPAGQLPATAATKSEVSAAVTTAEVASDAAGTAASAVAIEAANREAADSALIPLTQKGAANGVATLDGSQKLTTSQIPPLSLTDPYVVHSEAEQLALSAHLGDFAIRTDTGKTYAHNSGTSGTMADWTEIPATGQVQSVNGHTGTVALTHTDVGADAAGAATTAAAAAEVAVAAAEKTRRAHLVSDQRLHSLSNFAAHFNPRRFPGLIYWSQASHLAETSLFGDIFNRANTEAGLGEQWTPDGASHLGIAGEKAFCPGEGGTVITEHFNGTSPDGQVVFKAEVPATGKGEVWLEGQVGATGNRILLKYNLETGVATLWSEHGGELTKLGEGTKAVKPKEICTFILACVNNKYTVLDPTHSPNQPTPIAGLNEVVDAGAFNVTNTGWGVGLSGAVKGVSVSLNTVTPPNEAPCACVPDLAQRAVANQAVQTVVANRPVYKAKGFNNLATIFYNGSSFLSSNVSLGPQPFTYIVVFEPESLAAEQTLIGSPTAGALRISITTAGRVVIAAEGGATLATSLESAEKVEAGKKAMLIVTLNTNGDYMFILNGRPLYFPGTSTPAFVEGPVTFGAAGAGTTKLLKANKPFECAYNRNLIASELLAAIEALSFEYGIPLQPRIGREVSVPVNLAGPVPGTNIAPSAANFAAGGALGGFAGFWSQSMASLETQVNENLALMNSLPGHKVGRILGSPIAVWEGLVSEPNYLLRVKKVAELFDAAGQQLHFVGGDLNKIAHGTPAMYETLLANCAKELVGHKVFAFEIMNEIVDSYGRISENQVIDWMRRWGAAIRAQLPGVPITISNVGRLGHVGATAGVAEQNSSALADYFMHKALDDIVDFHSVHFYPGTNSHIVLSTITAILLNSLKPVHIGEYGIKRTEATEAECRAYYETINAIVAIDPRIIGASAWSLTDSEEKEGMFTNTLAPFKPFVEPFNAMISGPVS